MENNEELTIEEILAKVQADARKQFIRRLLIGVGATIATTALTVFAIDRMMIGPYEDEPLEDEGDDSTEEIDS